MDINNNNTNNRNDQNQMEHPDNTLTPRIPGYFQTLLTQPPLVAPNNISESQTRFQALKKLSRPQSTRGVIVDQVIFG
jgi:hypothetical protein